MRSTPSDMMPPLMKNKTPATAIPTSRAAIIIIRFPPAPAILVRATRTWSATQGRLRIYGERGGDGSILHDADLDVCHRHTHAITWDGQTVIMYHYHATPEYPYTLGCYHGAAVH